jgi:hypothetical protein
MNSSNASARGQFRGFLAVCALLGAILVVLFSRSFVPSEVVFSNDGPFGAMASHHAKVPAIITGYWQDLNWIGTPYPSLSPTISAFLHLVMSPLIFSKLFCPATLFILGLCAWFCFRQLKLSSLACILGAVATMLSSHFLSTACWGVAAQVVGIGMCFVAVGLVGNRSGRMYWLRLVLAGLAVGMNVMEGYDIGAIFSLFVAAFVLYENLVHESVLLRGLVKGTLQAVTVAIFAAFCASQALDVLVATQIKGITDEKANMTPEERWDWATQWSMPPSELTRIFIPGLYGYRMDTPKDMAALSDWFEGGVYWGEVGSSPQIDRYIEQYHAQGNKGIPPGIPDNAWRFNGGGEYAGVLVVVVGIWTIVQSFRKKDSVFTLEERKRIWFWSGAALIALLLATGRYAPFYRLFYMLPHAGNIRNASKFMHPFHWSLVILFAYGIHGLSRRYLTTSASSAEPAPRKAAVPQKTGWAALPVFEQRWVLFSIMALGVSLISFLAYSLNHDGLVKHLVEVGFPNADFASRIASFSIKEFGWFVLFLFLTVGLLTLIFMRRFAGNKWGPILLGALLVLDLVRADLPWIIYQNWVVKYASNPVIDFLKDKPYEHRVAVFPVDRFMDFQHLSPEAKPIADLYGQLAGLYRIEWAQHHFQYYNIQSLEDVQRPREAADFKAYERGPLGRMPFRHWELTNTKYFLAPAALGPSLAANGFRPLLGFNIQARPDATGPLTSYEQFTAVPTTVNPQYAIFEFTNTLPRAQLYSNWQIDTNDSAVLEALTSTNFNAHKTVIVSGAALPAAPAIATNQNAGSVDIASYAPKKVVLNAKATTPSVLLLNDKYDPNWHVTVDGKPATLLRLNFIMRGVALTPGDHEIVFHFAPPTTSLYVSLAAIALGFVLIGVLAVVRNGAPAPAAPEPAAKPAASAKKEK